MAISSLEDEETANNLKNKLLANLPEEQKQVLSQMSLTDIIKNIPEEQREKIIEELNSKLEQMPDTIIDQAAITQIKIRI